MRADEVLELLRRRVNDMKPLLAGGGMSGLRPCTPSNIVRGGEDAVSRFTVGNIKTPSLSTVDEHVEDESDDDEDDEEYLLIFGDTAATGADEGTLAR